MNTNPQHARLISIVHAPGCAWRATYVRVKSWQICYIGIDPTTEYGPKLFGGVSLSRRASWSFRVALPSVSWPLGWRLRRFGGLAAHRVSSRFWHSLDGRYGGR